MTALLPYAVGAVEGAPVVEPITVDYLKQLARHERDDEDQLCANFIAAARQQVERDTDLVLATQPWQLGYHDGPVEGQALLVPLVPVSGVTAITVVAADGTPTPLSADSWIVDRSSAEATRIWHAPAAAPWPPAEVGARWDVEIAAGWAGPIPSLLAHAVGVLASHMLTLGRDVVVTGTIVADVPQTYLDAIQPFRRITLI